MIHPHTTLRFINDAVGYGVFATEDIPEGTLVYVKDSLEIELSPEQVAKEKPEMQEIIEKFSYIDERGYRIISWDLGKYVNHCCNCNTISTGYGFEIAIRNIKAGEQITDEYGLFNMDQEFPLVCSNGNCRGILKPDDMETLYPIWDSKIKRSLSKFREVKQPLLPFVDETTVEELNTFFKNPDAYKSVIGLKYHHPESVQSSK